MKVFVGFVAFLSALSALAAGVKVSERFGFDAADSADILQAALDSGLPELILDAQPSAWVVSKPLTVRSGTKVVFEPGVVIEAKRGAFRGTGDCLLNLPHVSGVELVGDGTATLRMHKADYWATPYEKSEHRHALSIASCEDVTVRGLRFEQSGGDGIYLGCWTAPNRRVRIVDCVCDGNNRQGLSVISASDLLVDGCVFSNTFGTAPMCGVDLEPNKPTHCFEKVVFRNCRTEANAAPGVEFYLKQSTRATPDFDVLFTNCVFSGDQGGFVFDMGNGKSSLEMPKGTVRLIDCRIENAAGPAIAVANKPEGTVELAFAGCMVVNCCTADTSRAEVSVTSLSGYEKPTDGIDFSALEIRREVERDWIEMPLPKTPTAALEGICGTVSLRGPGASVREETLDAAWRAARFDVEVQEATLPEAKPTFAGTASADLKPGELVDLKPFALRQTFRYLIRADRAGPVRLFADFRPLSPKASAESHWIGFYNYETGAYVDARTVMSGGEVDFGFTAPAPGFYFFSLNAGNGLRFALTKSDAPVALMTEGQFPAFLGSCGYLTFYIPAGERFAVLAKGGDSGTGTAGERVAVRVCGPDGRVLHENRAILELDRCQPAQGPERGGFYSIVVNRPDEGVLDDWSVALTGVPGLLFLSDEKRWTFAGAVPEPAAPELWRLNASNQRPMNDGQWWTSAVTGRKGGVGEPLDPEDDYRAGWKSWQGFKSYGETFGGGRLILGDRTVPGARCRYLDYSGVQVFPREGLVLEQCDVVNNLYDAGEVRDTRIIGRVTLAARERGLVRCLPGYRKNRLLLGLSEDGVAGGFRGAPGTVMTVHNCNTDGTELSNAVFRAYNAADFNGTIVATSSFATVGWGPGGGVAVEPVSDLPGEIVIENGSCLRAVATDLGRAVRIGTLTFDGGGVLEVDYDAATGSCPMAEVTTALNFPTGRVFVAVPAYRPTFATATAFNREVRLSVLKASGAARDDLRRHRFELYAEPEHDWTRIGNVVCPKRGRFEYQEATGVLDLVLEPVVLYTGSGSDLDYEGEKSLSSAQQRGSAFQKSCWSDGRVPHAGAHYFIPNNCVSAPFGDADWTFPGLSLIVNSASQYPLQVFGRHTLSFPKGIDFVSGQIRQGQGSVVTLTGGPIRLRADRSLKLSAYANNTLTVCNDFVSCGAVQDIHLTGPTYTGSPMGRYALRGDNSRFLGRFVFDAWGTSTVSPPAYDSYRALVIADGRALGGRCPAFTADALSIQQFNRLAVEQDVELADGLNRGISIHTGGGTIEVASGKTLTCRWPVTLAAPLYKAGAGTVAFGGGFRVADASANVLYVKEGRVKPLAAGAFAGLSLDFAAGTALDVDAALLGARGRLELGCTEISAPGGLPPLLVDGVAREDVRLLHDGEAFVIESRGEGLLLLLR